MLLVSNEILIGFYFDNAILLQNKDMPAHHGVMVIRRSKITATRIENNIKVTVRRTEFLLVRVKAWKFNLTSHQDNN
jgi:hypothetical protein